MVECYSGALLVNQAAAWSLERHELEVGGYGAPEFGFLVVPHQGAARDDESESDREANSDSRSRGYQRRLS